MSLLAPEQVRVAFQCIFSNVFPIVLVQGFEECTAAVSCH